MHYSSNSPSNISRMMREHDMPPWIIPIREQPTQIPLPVYVPYYAPEDEKREDNEPAPLRFV